MLDKIITIFHNNLINFFFNFIKFVVSCILTLEPINFLYIVEIHLFTILFYFSYIEL